MLPSFNHFSGLLVVFEIIYLIGALLLSAKIIMDTKTASKALAYLMLIIFLPVVGVIIYFVFGVNYRRNRFFRFKIVRNEDVYQRVNKFLFAYHQSTLEVLPDDARSFQNTINFLFTSSHSTLTAGNHVEVLVNGEEKFPRVMGIVARAKHHIHIEYYIFENDKIGNCMADLLIKKAREGVEVRFLYDAFGSRKLGNKFLEKLQNAGVMVAPVNKIRFKILANRLNYRDHRKIIIVDGQHVFTGGINVSDRYINPNKGKYWRDTHVYIRGNGAFYFQYLFLANWIFAVEAHIKNMEIYFKLSDECYGNKFVQVASSGPDVKPAIMLSTASSIYQAKNRIYITTPYFIPVDTVLDAIKTQALAGLDVRLLVPRLGDSVMVNAAAYSYYGELLRNGVRIFFYEKGFVHAKTMLMDDCFSVIGTANMDVRSQELNFEVNTLIYDKEINRRLCDIYLADLAESTEIKLDKWKKRPKVNVFFEHLARIFSPII
jgi:cardiolipin synthase